MEFDSVAEQEDALIVESVAQCRVGLVEGFCAILELFGDISRERVRVLVSLQDVFDVRRYDKQRLDLPICLARPLHVLSEGCQQQAQEVFHLGGLALEHGEVIRPEEHGPLQVRVRARRSQGLPQGTVMFYCPFFALR